MTKEIQLEKDYLIELEPNEYGVVHITVELSNAGYSIQPSGSSEFVFNFTTLLKYKHYEFDVREGQSVFIKAHKPTKLFIDEGSIAI